MDQVKCNVIRDLLPLYVDDVLSVESCALIEAHMEDCVACRQQLEKLRVKVPETPNAGAEMSAGQAMRALNRSIKRKTKWGILIGLMVAVALFFGAFAANIVLFEKTDTPIGASGIVDYALTKLNTGQMVFAVDLKEVTALHAWMTDMVDEGGGTALYITPQRPLFERPFRTYRPSMEDVQRANVFFRDGSAFNEWDLIMFDEDDEKVSIELSRIYLGAQEDALLIWETGDVVPAAQDWVEELYGHGREDTFG